MKRKIYKIRYKFTLADVADDISNLVILDLQQINHKKYSGYDKYSVETRGQYTRTLDTSVENITEVGMYEHFFDMFLYDWDKFTENGNNLLSRTIFKHIRNYKLKNLINN